MITTITLNPALDKTCFGERMCPGQVNRMDRVRNLPGGKGINVTRVLAGYGFPVRAMGFLGGHTGLYTDFRKHQNQYQPDHRGRLCDRNPGAWSSGHRNGAF